MSEWKTIDTAPDSGDFLIAFRNGSVFPVLKRGDKWFFYDGEHLYGQHAMTHWQPFPDAPSNDTP